MEKALDLLSKHRNIVLATIEENKPKVRVLQIMKQEGTAFYFATSKEKAVCKQLQQNPYAEFIALYGDISVRVAAKVFFDVSDDMMKRIYDNNPVLHRFHDNYRSIAYFGLSAEKIDYYDLGTAPVTFQSFLLT